MNELSPSPMALILSASRAIVDSTDPEQLLSTFLSAVTTQTKALKTLLVLLVSEQWQAVAINSSNQTQIDLSGINTTFASTAVQLAWKTLNPVDWPQYDPNREPDEYYHSQKPQSLMCIPLIQYGVAVAVLYLENADQPLAFDQNQQQISQLLCHQVASPLACLLHLSDQNRALASQLEEARQQVLASARLASLGFLSAGIAHELRNPLNFVNNYAESSVEMVQELIAEVDHLSSVSPDASSFDYLHSLLGDIKENSLAISRHGRRASGIIVSMMQQARDDQGEPQPADVNVLLEQALHLAYHSRRVQDSNFNLTAHEDYDRLVPNLNLYTGDLSRAFINLIDNACYAVRAKQKQLAEAYEPTLWVSTRNLEKSVEIRIKDNGIGIPDHVKAKIFQPFFTTKPSGEGTGLGLPMTYEIITSQHKGMLTVESQTNVGTEFVITLPHTY